MQVMNVLRWTGWALFCGFLCGCAAKPVYIPEDYLYPNATEEEPRAVERPLPHRPAVLDRSWKVRRITEKELLQLSRKDPDLTLTVCLEILARLNVRARYYVREDVKSGAILKVPNNFSAYKDWTPLPRVLPGAAANAKFILIVKNIPFIGWYVRGRLLADTQICIGKKWTWTKAGTYTVLDKDANHFSQSYPNAYGEPTPMPWALRIYDHVWIHAGDVVGGYCSHGCINLPLEEAKTLFEWADKGTVVFIAESLSDLDALRSPRPAEARPAVRR